MGEDFTSAGIVSLFKKCRTVLEIFKWVLYEAVDVLASHNEVLPSMKYLQCEPSKLATTLKVFPYIRNLVVMPFKRTIDDVIKLQHTIKNNHTVNYLHISAIPFGGFVAYNLLRSLNIIFPQIILNKK